MADRPLKVGEMIKRALSQIIRETLIDKSLEETSVMISEVRMSLDLKFATIYILPLTGGKLSYNNLLEVFNNNSSKLKSLLCKKVSLRYAPQFIFKIDETLDKAEKINKLVSH